MKHIILLLLTLICLSSCSCDMEITYCDGLTNNNIKIVDQSNNSSSIEESSQKDDAVGGG